MKSRLGSLALALGAVVWLGACTDTVTRTVFVDRPPYNPAPDSLGGFLGYYTDSTQQTTCGNCHVGQQTDWIKTGHAEAWDVLQQSPFNTASCAGAFCHSVNWRGNQDSAQVGYEKVQSAGYHDVQCESCHGPGIEHVKNPSVKANQPLASVKVSDDPALADKSCSGCHRAGAGPDRHQDYLGEWRSSRHGQLRLSQARNAGCQPCHEGKGALRAWGITRAYKEASSTADADLIEQNCVVCHDPHGSAQDANGNPLPGQLRFPINTPVIGQNLCMNNCHGRADRGLPTPTNLRGPHGVQGLVLLGEAGYFPPGSAYDTLSILTSHGSTANPRLCAGCHVNKVSGKDGSGNTITFSGHSFQPLPCLIQKTPEEIVDPTYRKDCPFDAPNRSWKSCTALGCHGDEATAVSRLSLIEVEIDGYVKTIWNNTTKCAGECIQVPDPTDGGYLAKIVAASPGQLRFSCSATSPYPPTPCTTAQDTIDLNTLTPAKAAMFNVQVLGGLEYASHPDGSHGVHNPFLYRALLQSTIADLLVNYPGILPAPPAPILAKIQAAIESGKLRVAPVTAQAVQKAYLAQQANGIQVGSR